MSRTAALMFIAALVALSLCIAPAAPAKSKSQNKTLRFSIVKHYRSYDVAKGHHRRFAVKHRARKVHVKGIGRCRLVRRTKQFIVVRAKTQSSVGTLTITSPNQGEFETGAATAVSWKISRAVSSGSFVVELVAEGTTAPIIVANATAVRKRVNYSATWTASQSLGTYRVQVRYRSAQGKTVASDTSDGTVTIVSSSSASTPTPTPTASASSTPTPTPTASASSTPTPAPTASASSTPTPTPTATQTPAADPLTAITEARAGDTVVVGQGTYTGSVVVPDGVTIVGTGSSTSWIKGKMTFGSDNVIRDLKIGNSGMNAVRNADGATNTVFESCRFRGGGGSSWTYVVNLGSGNACSDVTFSDCEIERNLGVEVSDQDKGYNNISIWCNRDTTVTDITFDDCHIGVSNGTATGSPRMGIECFNYDDTVAGGGWKNVTLRNCVFEATDGHSADFSDQPFARATGLLIEGCTFKGGGMGGKWGWTLDLEMPLNPVVRNNTFYRGMGNWGYVIAVCDRDDSSYTSCGAKITGNTINLDADNGIDPVTYGWPILLNGYDTAFTGNVVSCHYGTASLFMLDHAYRSVITGNTFNIGSRPLITTIHSSANNTTSPNTVN